MFGLVLSIAALGVAAFVLLQVVRQPPRRPATTPTNGAAVSQGPVDGNAWRDEAEPLPDEFRLTGDHLAIDPRTVLLGRGIVSPEVNAARPDTTVGAHEDVTCDLAREGHLLIVGDAGQGKTALCTSILTQWVIGGGDAVIADSTGMGYREFETVLGVTVVEAGVAKLEAALLTVLAEVDARFSRLKSARVTNFASLPADAGIKPLLVVLDSATELLMLEPVRGSATVAAERMLAAQAREHVAKIARLGHAVGVHLVLTTQRAEHARDDLANQDKGDGGLPAAVLTNLVGRVLLGATDSLTRLRAGFPDLEVATTPGKAGRGLYGRVNAHPVEVQFGHLPYGQLGG